MFDGKPLSSHTTTSMQLSMKYDFHFTFIHTKMTNIINNIHDSFPPRPASASVSKGMTCSMLIYIRDNTHTTLFCCLHVSHAVHTHN